MEMKYAATETLIREVKNKIYEYLTSVSKNGCIDKFDDLITCQCN